MSLTTVNVLCRASDQLGNPIAGAVISAKLSGVDVDATNGYVLPEIISGVADANGLLTLALWPNELGSTATYYDIKITNPDTGKKISLTATIPNATCELHLVAGLPPYEGKSDGQLFIDAAVAAVAPAVAAKLGAEAALAATVIQAGTATTQAGIATSQAVVATTQAGIATADVALTHADVVTTNADVLLTHADAALTSADVTATHADVVTTGADVALTHADAVTTGADVVISSTQAGIATTKAAEAAASANSFAVNFAQMAASLVNTQAVVATHHAFT